MNYASRVEQEWIECLNCGATGFRGHNCGEDTCCCRCPEENDQCSICEGEGGWWEQDQ